MKYFSYNPNCLIDNIGGYNLAFSSLRVEEIENEEPLVLSPKLIQTFLSKFKEIKAEHKKLAYKFNTLQPTEQLTLLKKFYGCDLFALVKFQLEAYKLEYPVAKTIKTSMFVENNDRTFSQAKVSVLAKQGVRFNPLKTYSKEEISKMIANGDIVIIRAEAVGKKFTTCDNSNLLNVEIIAKEFSEDVIDEDTYEILARKNPQVLEELISSVDSRDLQNYYEFYFLSAYKKMLDYLVKCAKVTVADRNAVKRNLQKQISKNTEEVREIEDITKQIIDTSKGR